ALLFIREPCIFDTARLGGIDELRALPDRDGEDDLTLEDPAAAPARPVPAGPPCAQAKLRASALPEARAEPLAPIAPLAPAKECHWPSAVARFAAAAAGPEMCALEPAPESEPAGGLAIEPPPRWGERLLNGAAPDGRPAKPPCLPPGRGAAPRPMEDPPDGPPPRKFPPPEKTSHPPPTPPKQTPPPPPPPPCNLPPPPPW